MAKVEHSATIYPRNMTWAEITEEVQQAGIPGTAKVKLHEYKSYTPTDYDVERIVFRWTTGS